MTVPSPAPAPGTRFRRVGGALSLIASGALVCGSLVLIPFETRSDAEYLQIGVDHTTTTLWAAVVRHYGYLLLVPAALTLVHLARRRSPTLALVAMLLSGLGAGLSGLVAVDVHDVALAEELPADQALRVLEVAGGYGQGALIAAPSLLGLALGTSLALAAAWRARAIPVYPVVLGVVGWAVFLAFSGDAWLPSLGTGLIAVATGWAGRVVLRMRDDVWNRI